MAVRPSRLGGLGQGDEQGGLGQRQALRLLAEPCQRRRAHAFQIAAIGRKRQIAAQDLVLRQPALDLPSAGDLPELGGKAALAARLDQPRELHRNGRAARYDTAIGDKLSGGAGKRHEIDAAMLAETPVLIGDEHVEERAVDILEVGIHAPAAFRRGEGAQEKAVTVDDLRRERRRIERWRKGTVERVGGPQRTARRQGDGSRAERGGPQSLECPPAHRCATTSIRPDAVRAENCGRYMSSTLAAGCT